MATLNIKIEQNEKDKTIIAIAQLKNEAKSVSAIAKQAGIGTNRMRFIIEEMVAEGSIRKVVTKKYNESYIRYRYEVTGK
jgi:IMP dehydrogenase/GMP reductase